MPVELEKREAGGRAKSGFGGAAGGRWPDRTGL